MRLSQSLGTLAFRLDRRGRAVALSNLECVFGDRFSAAQRAQIAATSYRNFVGTMVDLFWGQRLTLENVRDWVEVEGREAIDARMKAEGCGAIFMSVHQGNWEWANLVGPAIGWPLMSVAENFKNPRLTALFQQLREHTGAVIIPQENSLVRMLKRVLRGGRTGMLLDLNLRPTQAATVIEAFRTEREEGLLMCVPMLHAVLGQRGKALLVPFTTRPLPNGRLLLRVLAPVEVPSDASLQTIAQRCWDALEPIIMAQPEEWLWPYKHFRYRPRNASRAYPAYANESGQFEKLRRRLAAEAAKAAEIGA
jgi:Kdo2-lipid IVA lauroyltransferase/acyltransferase